MVLFMHLKYVCKRIHSFLKIVFKLKQNSDYLLNLFLSIPLPYSDLDFCQRPVCGIPHPFSPHTQIFPYNGQSDLFQNAIVNRSFNSLKFLIDFPLLFKIKTIYKMTLCFRTIGLYSPALCIPVTLNFQFLKHAELPLPQVLCV